MSTLFERVKRDTKRYALKLSPGDGSKPTLFSLPCYDENESAERCAKYVASAIECLAAFGGHHIQPGDSFTVVDNPNDE